MLFRLLLLLAAAFAIGWFGVPAPQPEVLLVQPRRSTPAPATWQLPGEPQASALMPSVMTAPFWGAQPTATAVVAPPAPDMRWRVAGVFGVGANRKIRIEFRDPARPPLTLKVSDKLPSGHVITRIDERTYCVDIEGASYTLGVERSE